MIAATTVVGPDLGQRPRLIAGWQFLCLTWQRKHSEAKSGDGSSENVDKAHDVKIQEQWMTGNGDGRSVSITKSV